VGRVDSQLRKPELGHNLSRAPVYANGTVLRHAVSPKFQARVFLLRQSAVGSKVSSAGGDDR
jgi:hypothetical protein